MSVPDIHGDGARTPGRRSRRFSLSRRTWRLLAAAAAVVLVMGIAIPAMAVLAGSPSNFEANDGNMVVNTTGNNDWASVNFVHVTDQSNSNSDNSFTPGQKQDTTCPDTTGHKNPGKDDFTDVASFNETNQTTGETYLYGATIRFTANGNASENVELKQSATLCPGQPTGGVTQRTPGDKLIAIDYLNGGTNVQFNVLTWIDGTDPTNPTCFVSNDQPPCWGAVVKPLSASAAEGLASQAAITAADNPISNQALVTGQFAEFGVNLSAAGIVPANSCQSFPQTVWESRSSGSSFVSSTKDIAIENHTIGNCTSSVSTNPQSSTDNSTFTDLANNASISSGTWVRDQATVTVTGTNVWRGNVDFYLCSSTTSTLTSCDPAGSNATHIGAQKPVGLGGTSPPGATATSDSTQVTNAGSYCWAAKFTATSPQGLPGSQSTTGECFSVTAPTSIATNPWFYPQDRAVISASSGGNLAGSVSFKLFDSSADCTANGTTGLLYQEGPVAVSGASPQTVDTTNSSYRVTSSTAGNLYWRVTYTSTNAAQTDSSSVCVENIGATITADGTVTFPPNAAA
jgi:hypothetical protein